MCGRTSLTASPLPAHSTDHNPMDVMNCGSAGVTLGDVPAGCRRRHPVPRLQHPRAAGEVGCWLVRLSRRWLPASPLCTATCDVHVNWRDAACLDCWNAWPPCIRRHACITSAHLHLPCTTGGRSPGPRLLRPSTYRSCTLQIAGQAASHQARRPAAARGPAVAAADGRGALLHAVHSLTPQRCATRRTTYVHTHAARLRSVWQLLHAAAQTHAADGAYSWPVHWPPMRDLRQARPPSPPGTRASTCREDVRMHARASPPPARPPAPPSAGAHPGAGRSRD